MAHFAELDDNNIVKQVIVVHNNELLDEYGKESEQKGVAFCATLFDGVWVQTSYNNNIRKNFAGVGFTYDASRDAFIAPQPYLSWQLDENTCRWVCPVEVPTDGSYNWNEELQQWEKIND